MIIVTIVIILTNCYNAHSQHTHVNHSLLEAILNKLLLSVFVQLLSSVLKS